MTRRRRPPPHAPRAAALAVALSTCIHGAAGAGGPAPLPEERATDGVAPVADLARVVVIVGYNGGEPDPRSPLSFADDDAARLFLQLAPSATRAWLLTTFDRESARAYPDLTDIARAPTKQALAGALGEAFWLLRQEKARGRQTELVFAFAGHGDVDDGGRGFVVFADGPFTREDLAAQVLAPSPADLNHVVVDACSSYFFVKSRGGRDAQEGVPLTPKLLDVLQQKDDAGLSADVRARTGLLVSTSTAAEVHESSTLSAGVFSYLLRSALTGVADVDGNGRVEYGETAAFLSSASAALDDPRARLSIHAEPPLQRPHAALIDLERSGARSFLAVDVEKPVHLRLLDPRGVPWAEVHTSGERPVYMALVGQPFFLVRRGDDEAVLVPRTAGAYALSSLDFGPGPTARGEIHPGPFDALFARPFDADFVDGFLSSSALPAPIGGAPFAPAWAASGAPPVRIPVGVIGGVAMGAAAVVGAGAVGAVVANQIAFSELEAGFRQTGQLDPAKSLEVDTWRDAATGLTLGAVALGLAGGALVLWSISLEEGEVALP